jgi:hypothetical protein
MPCLTTLINHSYFDWGEPMTDTTRCALRSGSAIAAAAALLFTSIAIPVAHATEAKLQCDGVNACKGTSACGTANNSCAGQNACKGQGWLLLTQADCDAAKAKINPPE